MFQQFNNIPIRGKVNKETLSVDEAEVLAGRFSSVSGRHYVFHDLEKLVYKYANAWTNFGINVFILLCFNELRTVQKINIVYKFYIIFILIQLKSYILKPSKDFGYFF